MGRLFARMRGWRLLSRALRSLGPHPRGLGGHNSSSYLQIVFCAEHVRVSDADAPERHRDKHRRLCLLPAVIAHLQRHPGRWLDRRMRMVRTSAARLLRQPGLPRTSPSGSVRPRCPGSQRAPGAPLRPPHKLPPRDGQGF